MYFNKIRHPSNFVFAAGEAASAGALVVQGETHRPVVTPLGGDVHRLDIQGPREWKNPSQAELAAALPGENAHAVSLTAGGGLAVVEKATGRVVLAGVPGATFGTCGDAWMLQFRHEPDMQFYGLGEHSRGLEKSGQRVKFWNTDLWGDFSMHDIRRESPNPMYVAIPWLIVKQGNRYVGLLVNHPGAVFMDLASNFIWEKNNPDDLARRSFYLGAPDGRPEIYLIVGPSLPELTRKLQTLVGRTPLPPLWALGHHQCRWGYGGPDDLRELDRQFSAHEIPTDGLWLDIDYMDRYKVFTYSPALWGGGDEVKKALAALAKKGRRVVPILDPGVKVEPGYFVHDDGLKQGVFCLTPAGRPYVGFVWPGQTYLPDFSLPEVRAWWAGHVKAFAETGAAGAWLDMNDPSVGAVELDDMRFDRGREPHASYHNQYALGMAQASRAGFLAAHPARRPFLLARSAFISSSRYTALWTGDNVSNWHHLRSSVPLTLGLALSGHPFNGPDVCGFGDDTTPALASAWYKAGFLFPFFRNHSIQGSRPQEPWALGAAAGRVIAHYIRLRYKLLPYLYQRFIAQEAAGEAILRPLFYDYADTAELPLGRIADQFLVGPDLLQAPVLEENATSRPVVLPGHHGWFSARDGRWLAGGQTLVVATAAAETPLFVREGALVPMQAGTRIDARNELGAIELHCFLRRSTSGVRTTTYAFDDGESFAYRDGVRTTATLEVANAADGTLALTVRDCQAGHRPLRVRVVVYDRYEAVTLTQGGRTRRLALAPHRWRFAGKPLRAAITARWITLT